MGEAYADIPRVRRVKGGFFIMERLLQYCRDQNGELCPEPWLSPEKEPSVKQNTQLSLQ